MKAYKTEIYPTKDQIKLIHQTCGNTRYIYNQFIAFNFERLEKKKPVVSGYDYSKMINHDPNIPSWLKTVSSKAFKQAIMNANGALWAYLKGKKGKPNFKKKSKDNSFYLIGTSFKVERHRIFLPTLKCLAPRFYPSSKLCSHCGYKNVVLKLKDRSWECPDCHAIHEHDENAAINLEQCTDYTVLTAV